MSRSDPPPNWHLPRILCLHGGGTNQEIFRLQCRTISAQLADRFRLVYAQGPIPVSTPGPDVLSVYADFGPFYAWTPMATGLTTSATDNGDEVAVMRTIEEVVRATMKADDDQVPAGVTPGPWTAVLGFSQGAKAAGSLLLRQQMMKAVGRTYPVCDFRFGVLIAGRGPLLCPPIETEESAGAATDAVQPPKLRVPTVHLHGLQDPGLLLHRKMREEWCDMGSTVLLEWDGEHRLPFKNADTRPLVDAILRLDQETR